MFSKQRPHTIENDLIRLTAAVLLSAILLCTIISNVILYKINYENIERYNNDMLSQISQSSNSYFRNMNHTIYNFVCSNQVQTQLMQAFKGNSFSSTTATNLRNFLILLSYSLPDCRLHLFMENPSVLPVHLEDMNFTPTPGYHYHEDLWYDSFSALPLEQMYYITTPEECHYYLNSKQDGIIIVYRIRNNSNLNTIGYLLVDVPERVLEQALNLRNQEQFYLKIEMPEQKTILNTFPENKHGKFFEMTSYDPLMDWTLTAYTQNNYFESNSLMVMFANIFCAMLVGVAAFLFSTHFAKSLTEPLKVLTSSMHEMEAGSFGKPIYCNADNEIGYLITQYNAMNQKIDELTKKKETAELAQKDAHIAVLQNQINPHFLYNTLECIRAMAMYQGCENVSELTVALSNVLRYAVKGENIVCIKDELNYIQEYSKIIECRFSKIRIELEIDNTLLEKKMVRLILQPLVENAVFHGLEPMINGGKVWIKIYKVNGKTKREWIYLSVEDNGFGMNGQRLQEIYNSMRDDEIGKENGSQSIGLVNIYQRLKLTYDDNMELFITSERGKGTKVVIGFAETV